MIFRLFFLMVEVAHQFQCASTGNRYSFPVDALGPQTPLLLSTSPCNAIHRRDTRYAACPVNQQSLNHRDVMASLSVVNHVMSA